MTTMTSEARSAALSIRAKLRKALAVDGFDLNAAEQKAIDATIMRISKAVTPAKKAAKKKTAKKPAAKKVAKKTASKKVTKKAA
jgi:hypothetical protein